MYNSQYYTCEQVDQRLLQGYLDDYNSENNTSLTKSQFLSLLATHLNSGLTTSNIVQESGNNTNKLMSQAIVTQLLSNLQSQINTESTNRSEADQTINGNLSTLSNNLNTESNNRETADQNINTQIGYYECNSEASATKKEVTITGYILPSTSPFGGHFKVKMLNSHGSNTPATLSVNNTGGTNGIPIRYNGEPVTKSNTWDTGEVIAVYYDGQYYQASNAQGGSNRKINDYLYGDLRTLTTGQTYYKGEAVKTNDKQLLRINKDIKPMFLTEEVTIGDLRVYNQQTYQAQSDIKNYNPAPSIPYDDGDYAIGSPTKLNLIIVKDALDSGDIVVNFGSNTVTIAVTSGDSASDIATAIASALNNVENIGWTFAASEGVISATCTTLGDNNGTQFSLSTEDSTGVIGTRAVVTEGDEETATVLSLTVTVGAGTLNVTLGESTQSITITSSDGAAAIAELIAGLTFTGWTLTFENNIVTAICNSAGNNSNVVFTVATNIFNVSGEKTIAYSGSDTVSVYNSVTGWSLITESEYVTLSDIWNGPLTDDDIKVIATEQNTLVKDIGDIKDVVLDYSYKTYGDFAGGGSSVTANNVFFFRQATLRNCLLQKIEFTTNYTGTIYIGFMDPATYKFVGKLRSYVLSDTNVIDLNIEIGDNPLMLGIGSSKAFLKYSYTSGGGTNDYRYETVANCYDGKTMKSYNRILSNYNWRITTKIIGTSLPQKIDDIDQKFSNDISGINDTLYPIEHKYYGEKGVGTTNLNYSSIWFYWKYVVSVGDIIESIELPSNYTGTFILCLADGGSRKVTEINNYTVSNSNIIPINKLITSGGILGFGATSSQIIKAGSTSVFSSMTGYISSSKLKIGEGINVSSSVSPRGHVNMKVNIKRILPTLEERVEALETNTNTVEKPYGEINIIPIHGQSLSLGIERSVPAIHTTPILGGLMFNTGIYQVDSNLDKMQGVKNLAEGASTIYSHPDYETSSWGTAEMIKKRIIDKFGDNIQTFYLTCGQNGSSINEQFDSELQVLERAVTRVKELFPYKKVKMPCFCYIQGEADQISSMTVETYKEKLEAGRLAIQEIAERILGQSTPVRCILYQTIRGTYNQKRISQAQMELCRDSEFYAPSTSVSTLIEMKNNDGLHLSNYGEYLLGQYQGIQFVDWIYFGHKNVGVMPLNISVNNNVITIKFKVAHPPLRFVTDWCTPVSNNGFSVMSNGVNIIASGGVVLKDCDCVQITCTQNIQNGDMLYYGISMSSSQDEGFHNQGHHGNLCDSQGELYTTDVQETNNTPYTVALNNYCYSFYEELSVG